MTTIPRHRTAWEKAALESARVAVARAQAHAQRGAAEPEPVVNPALEPAPTSPRFTPQEESTSSAAAWRRRCWQIREEIEAARAPEHPPIQPNRQEPPA